MQHDIPCSMVANESRYCPLPLCAPLHRSRRIKVQRPKCYVLRESIKPLCMWRVGASVRHKAAIDVLANRDISQWTASPVVLSASEESGTDAEAQPLPRRSLYKFMPRVPALSVTSGSGS